MRKAKPKKVISIVPLGLSKKGLEAWIKKVSRWSANDFLVTLDDGTKYTAALTIEGYKKQIVEMKLIKQGADPALLREYGSFCYSEGSYDEAESQAGESL